MRKVLNPRHLTAVIAVLSGLLLAQTVFAQVQWRKFSYFKNYLGLNDNLSSTEIEDNEASDIQNVVFDTGGALKKRFGYTAIPDDPVESVATGSVTAITGLSFYKKNNENRYIVAVCNVSNKATAMKKDYASSTLGLETGAWENIDFNMLPSSYSDNYPCDFAVAQDVLIFTVGARAPPYKWDGSGKVGYLTGNANVPSGTLVEYHKNQLFVSGDSNSPSRVYFSNLDDIYTYTATDFFDVEISDGSQVRGMKSAFDSLYIFKDKSIWRLSGTNRDDFTLSLMVSGIGTLSNNSIQVIGGLIYFTTAQNDEAVYDGGYNVKFISQKIRNTIGGMNFQRASTTQGLAFSTYKYVDYDYYCSMSTFGSSTNNTVLLFDTAYEAWTKFKGINAASWCVADDDNGQNCLIFGDYNGYVHQYPSTQYYDADVATSPVAGFNEVTSAIAALYQTKWFKYDDVALGDKYWRLLKTYTLAESTDTYLYAECKADQESSGKVVTLNLFSSASLWDIAQWDVGLWGGQTIMVNRSEIEKGTEMFQIKYYNDDVNKGFTILGYQIFIEPTDRI